MLDSCLWGSRMNTDTPPCCITFAATQQLAVWQEDYHTDRPLLGLSQRILAELAALFARKSRRSTIRDFWRWSSHLSSNAARGRKRYAWRCERWDSRKERSVLTPLRFIAALSLLTPGLALAQNPDSPVVRRGVLSRNLARTWDFETGDLRGWTASGRALAQQPTFGDNPTARGRGQPAGQQGQYWIGTYELYPKDSSGLKPGGIQGDGPQGTLTSPDFTVATDSVSFLIGGGNSLATGVELVLVVNMIDIAERRAYFATGLNTETMRRVAWDLQPYRGQVARIRIIDASSGPWGHVNADDFRFFNATTPPGPTLTEVPDLIGKDLTRAMVLLDSAHLTRGHIDTVETSGTAGLIVRQYPMAHHQDTTGTPVAIYLAKAPLPAGVPVPNVIGQSREQAEEMIRAVGLEVGQVDEIPADTIAPGVAQQFPHPESSLTLPGHVDLVLAVVIPPARIAVPNVVGKGGADARTTIEAAGLVVASQSGATGKRVVASQSPAAGDSAEVGSQVSLDFKSADLPGVIVPDLQNLRLDQAESLLVTRTLKRSGLTYVEHSSRSGTVVGQTPGPGESVSAGSSVHVYVAAPRAADWTRIALIVLGIAATAAAVVRFWPRPPIPILGARPGGSLGHQEFEGTGPSTPVFEIRFRPGLDSGAQVVDLDRRSVVSERREQ